MEPGEYDALSRAEERHWWFVGLRDLLARLLPRALRASAPRVLDAGCGTGANLRLLRDVLKPAYVGGFDREPRAVALARAKVPGADVYESDLCAPVLHADALDLVLSVDVVYVPGVERARTGLAQLAERLAPGGVFALHLPAYRWLRSEHDVAVHGTERYTAREARALLESLGLSVELVTYRLCALLPLLVASRLGRFGAARREGARSDLHVDPDPRVNAALLGVVRAENAAIAAGARMPFGSSILALGRKR